jgi:hypothetical protein
MQRLSKSQPNVSEDLDSLGGEPLNGSGFETEESEADLDDRFEGEE